MARIKMRINSREDQSIERYLEEINKVPLLKPEEEIDLAKRIKKNSKLALKKLVEANLRFVVSVAKDYQNQGLPLSDLINEGNLGLMKAAERFDETRGFKFISYAVWWIRQSILQAIAEHSRIVRLPLNRVGMLNKIGKKYNELEQEYEREPSTEEIAVELEIKDYDVSDALRISKRHLSLDAPLQEDEKSVLMDTVPDKVNPLPDQTLMKESLGVDIDNVLNSLTEREAKIIKLYFGIGMERSLTLEEIGEEFRLTRERVRQIKEKAINRLRHKSRSKALRAYLG